MSKASSRYTKQANKISLATKRVYNGMVKANPSEYFDSREMVSPPHEWVHVWNRHLKSYTSLKPILASSEFSVDQAIQDERHVFGQTNRTGSITDNLIRDRGFKTKTAEECAAIVLGIEANLGDACGIPLALGILITKMIHNSDIRLSRFTLGDSVFAPGDGGSDKNSDGEFSETVFSRLEVSSREHVFSTRFAVISPLGVRCRELYFPYGTILTPTHLTRSRIRFQSQTDQSVVVRKIFFLHLENGGTLAYNRSQIQQAVPFNGLGQRGEHLKSQKAFDDLVWMETGAFDSLHGPRDLKFSVWKRERKKLHGERARQRKEEKKRLAKEYDEKKKRFDLVATRLMRAARQLGAFCDEVLEDCRLNDKRFDSKGFQRDCDRLEKCLSKVGESHLCRLSHTAKRVAERI